MKSKAEKLRDRLIQQRDRLGDLIIKKFKLKENSREVTKDAVWWSLYNRAASTENTTNEYLESHREWLDERLTHLEPSQMEVIRMYFWEGKTFEEIGKVIGLTPSGAFRRFNKCIEVLREG